LSGVPCTGPVLGAASIKDSAVLKSTISISSSLGRSSPSCFSQTRTLRTVESAFCSIKSIRDFSPKSPLLIVVLLRTVRFPPASSTGSKECVQICQRTAQGLSNRHLNSKRIRVSGDDVFVLWEVRLISLYHLQSFRAGRFLVGTAGVVVVRQS